MIRLATVSRLSAPPWSLATCAALLVTLPGLAGAAEGARLEVSWGPNQTAQVALFAVKAILDGQALPLRTPELNATGARPIYEGPLPAGSHRLLVTVTLAGQNPVFKYVEEYHLDLSGQLEFASASQGTVKATVRIRDQNGLSVAWTDRYALDLSAVGTTPPSPPAPEADVAEEAPAHPVIAPGAFLVAPAPLPGPPPVAGAAPCLLEPIHFGLARATISQPAEVALDRFAACLARSAAGVRLVGHCDRRGSDASNLRLGEERAEATARFLEQRGVAASRLRVESRGAAAPLCADDTSACHARNRRVEAVVAAP